MPARVAIIVLGGWLFISAFVWPHSPSQLTNTWVLGVLCVTFGLIALAIPQSRYLNVGVAAWLFVSAWVLPRMNTLTVVNNVLVAIAVFLLSIVPEDRFALRARRHAHSTP